MNYRHAFHAGNFADLLKHAVLTQALARLTAARGPLMVIDTHAGAGLYDLAAEEARRTGEGAAGIGRLMASREAPAAFAPLLAAVGRAGGGPAARRYPGSPLLIADALRPGDRAIACELRPDDHAALRRALRGRKGVEAVLGDGWRLAEDRAPPAPHRLLVLIDPPFERGDDARLAGRLAGRLLKRNRAAVIAIWAPIKDLASFDAFVGALEDAAAPAPILLAEARLRALDDPTRLNGCAVAVVNPPAGLQVAAAAAAEWIAAELGEAGGLGRAALL